MGGSSGKYLRHKVNVDLVVHPDAASDIADVHDWYEARSPGLGHRFLSELDARLDSVRRFPDAAPVVATACGAT